MTQLRESTDEVEAAADEKRMIEWFRDEDAPGLLESGILLGSAALNPEIDEQLDRSPIRAGARVRVLFRDPSPGGFSLVHAWFGEDYPLPRHNHNTDCLYYVLAGELRMGSKVINAGDGLVVPARRTYTFRAGPGGAEFLEFRAANAFDTQILDQSVEKWRGFVAAATTKQAQWQETRPVDA